MDIQQDKIYRGEGQAAQENPLMSLMRDYVAAKTAFDQACQSLSQCQQQRAEAEKRLFALSEKVTKVVADGMYDPTIPQPAVPTPNGLTQGFGQRSY